MAGNVRTPSTTTERNFQVKTKEGDPQAAYLEDKIDGSTYINITEDDGTYGKKLVVEADVSAILSAVSNKVKVSSADPTAEYLEDKITAGTGIEVTCDDDTVTVALDAELKNLNDVDGSLSPSDKDILVYDGVTDNQWETSHGLETTFSGTTTKVPTALALSTLLKTLIVTNDADLGSGGTPIMYHEDNFDSSRILIVSDNSTNLTSNYPDPADLIACVPDRRTDSTTAAALVSVGENAWDRAAYGDLFIGTYEGDDEDADAFVGAYLETLLQEDYISGEDIYLDVMFKLASTSAADWETKVKAFPYYIQAGEAKWNKKSQYDVNSIDC